MVGAIVLIGCDAMVYKFVNGNEYKAVHLKRLLGLSEVDGTIR